MQELSAILRVLQRRLQTFPEHVWHMQIQWPSDIQSVNSNRSPAHVCRHSSLAANWSGRSVGWHCNTATTLTGDGCSVARLCLNTQPGYSLQTTSAKNQIQVQSLDLRC